MLSNGVINVLLVQHEGTVSYTCPPTSNFQLPTSLFPIPYSLFPIVIRYIFQYTTLYGSDTKQP